MFFVVFFKFYILYFVPDEIILQFLSVLSVSGTQLCIRLASRLSELAVVLFTKYANERRSQFF